MDMKQSVSGEGYFMTYKYARMPNTLGLSGIGNNGVELMDYSHGSGRSIPNRYCPHRLPTRQIMASTRARTTIRIMLRR
jgi:hypothetical protein